MKKVYIPEDADSKIRRNTKKLSFRCSLTPESADDVEMYLLTYKKLQQERLRFIPQFMDWVTLMVSGKKDHGITAENVEHRFLEYLKTKVQL